MDSYSQRFVKDGHLDDEIEKQRSAWRQNRLPDDPEEMPENVDTRPLYFRLKEAQEKADKEEEDIDGKRSNYNCLTEDDLEYYNSFERNRWLVTPADLDEEKKIVEQLKLREDQKKMFNQKLSNIDRLEPPKINKNNSNKIIKKTNKPNKVKRIIGINEKIIVNKIVKKHLKSSSNNRNNSNLPNNNNNNKKNDDDDDKSKKKTNNLLPLAVYDSDE
ncbi:hypothetical protein SNEBB_004847 [Seison nebaliae]|nr:hypothetical protein SNEBB_004847 [Seison nebaliae]